MDLGLHNTMMTGVLCFKAARVIPVSSPVFDIHQLISTSNLCKVHDAHKVLSEDAHQKKVDTLQLLTWVSKVIRVIGTAQLALHSCAQNTVSMVVP